MIDYDSYMICTSPRSGSTLLCHLLASTRAAGYPESYFHEPSVASWLTELGTPMANDPTHLDALRVAVDNAIVTGRGDTPIFGLRLQRHSFDYFIRQMRRLAPADARDRDVLRSLFGSTLFVYLHRPQKDEQAVSYIKAKQTGLWHQAPDGTELERLAEPCEPWYDSAEITRQIQMLRAQDEAWEEWFRVERISPLRLTYSALSEQPLSVIARVLDRLGVPREAATGVQPGVAKLADSVSAEWLSRYRAECR